VLIFVTSCKDEEPIQPREEIISLPEIFITTENNEPVVSKDVYLNATFVFKDSTGAWADIDTTATTIKGRGNTTWTHYPKKPYKLKFKDKISLFGLIAAKEWVLLANAIDETFGLMNAVAFEAAHRLGMSYTNHSYFVDLYLNDEYQGIYQLTEQVEVKEGRIDIDENNSLLIEMSEEFDEPFQFRSDILNLPVMIKNPESDAGVEYAKQLINELEKLLFAENFPNNKWRDLVNVNSLIDYLIVQEIAGNYECYHPKSTYMYVEKLGNGNKYDKITFGPVWDFDHAFGWVNGDKHFLADNKIIFSKDTEEYLAGSKFFRQFFYDSDFVNQYKAYWNKMKSQFNFDNFIDKQAKYINISAEKDMGLWEYWYHRTQKYDEYISEMKKYIKDRIIFLDGQINSW
jgi:hypothetical protein